MNVARTTLLVLAGAFLILLPIQFAVAGYGIFSGDYDAHEVLGGLVLHALVLLMVIAALAGRLWERAGWAFLMFVVIFVQIALVSIGRDAGHAWVSGLHPFLAFCYWPFTYFLIWQPVRGMTPTQHRAQRVERPRAPGGPTVAAG